MTGFVSWWHRPDQYYQLSSYLQARGMANAMRVRVAGIAASLSVIVAFSIWTPTGPRGTVATMFAVAASAVGAAGAVLWASRWPSRAQAITFALGSTTAIFTAALVQSSPVACLLGCTALAALAVHVAFFYAAPVVVYNVACAAVVAVVAAVRLTPSIGPGSAIAACWLMMSVNLAAPVGLHMTSRIIGLDVVLADRDPLTSLWNRRAFSLRAEQMLIDARHDGVMFALAIIDLDHFKLLNDRAGHQAGDQALAAVAAALLDSCDERAIVGRVGGEEFAIADTSTRWLHPDALSSKVCQSIAAVPYEVTASVGVARLDPNDDASGVSARIMLTHVMSRADAAMYAAKAAGGNRAQHCKQQTWAVDPDQTQ